MHGIYVRATCLQVCNYDDDLFAIITKGKVFFNQLKDTVWVYEGKYISEVIFTVQVI